MSTLPDPRRIVETSPPVAELERRMQWPVLEVLAFLGCLAMLLALALFALRPLPPPTTGLPDDPDVRAAAASVEDIRVSIQGLRVHSSILGGEAAGEAPSPADAARLAEAEALLARARRRLPRDPRVPAALAAIELARGRAGMAEALYRDAAHGSRNFGEAHVGLAVALELAAEVNPDPLFARACRLRAIAHCAAVTSDDPAYPAALYDRALLLARVGRGSEARRMARRYLELDAGPWAAQLRGEMAF